jgi:hypothetical protein
VVYEGVQALDVGGPMDVFSEANTFLGSGDRYETVLIAAHRDPLRASNGSASPRCSISRIALSESGTISRGDVPV